MDVDAAPGVTGETAEKEPVGEGDECEESDDEILDLDAHLEPIRTPPARAEPNATNNGPEEPENTNLRKGIYNVGEKLYSTPVVYQFGGLAGKVYGTEEICGEKIYQHKVGVSENVYTPFSSKLDWEVAKWAKLRGPSSTAFTELMGIEGVSNT